MDKIIIQGGQKLCGEVQISGAKNAALPILCSALLTEGWNTYHNIPDLMDIRTVKKLIGSFGAEISGEGSVRVNAANMTHAEASYELVKT
ncbi:MAG: UDP-N-acetylglucosamine 1-carboxyvinyltransferase, partial [Deltaproteobacteria bacterium]|nr:UDP-N-acetylglucosamine 1-carboxyvinyltransferase [Deltaproteobacteria bacterium]